MAEEKLTVRRGQEQRLFFSGDSLCTCMVNENTHMNIYISMFTVAPRPTPFAFKARHTCENTDGKILFFPVKQQR